MTLIALGLIHFRRKGSVILNFSELLFWKKTVTNQLLDKDHSSQPNARQPKVSLFLFNMPRHH